MKIDLTYDPVADAAYLRLAPCKVAESEEVAPGVVFDRSVDGKIVGVEWLRASDALGMGALEAG